MIRSIRFFRQLNRQMQVWAQNIPELEDAEASQREWSSEYFAKWMKTSQAGSLGKIPVIVLTRSDGGYDDGQDVPAAQLEKERKEGQAMLGATLCQQQADRH